MSPFGALGGSSKPSQIEGDENTKPAATASSAFASSSLASFSASEQSPFGSVGSSSGSVFKNPAGTTGSEKPTGFAAAAGPSPFASTGASGFASLGSGFSGFAGASKPGGLTNFASSGGPSVLSSTSKAKPFGAPEEEEEKEESTESGPGEFEEDKTDERFYERESMYPVLILQLILTDCQLKPARKKRRHTSHPKRSSSNSRTRSGESAGLALSK